MSTTEDRTLVIETFETKSQVSYSVPTLLLVGWDYTMPVEVLQDYADDPDSGVLWLDETSRTVSSQVEIMRDM